MQRTLHHKQGLALIAGFSLAFALLLLPNTARADEETPTPPKEDGQLFQEPDSTSIRVQRGTFIGAVGAGIMNQEEVWPSLGIRATFTADPAFAIVTQIRSLGWVTFLSGGVAWYWFDSAITPYLYGRMGGFFVLHIPAGGSFQTGLGVEYAASNGLTIGLEGGLNTWLGTFDNDNPGEVTDVGLMGEAYVVVGYRY